MTGEYQHTLDTKGRLAVPARLRAELGDCFYVTKGPDRCLLVFPMESWREMEIRVTALSLAESRNFRRLFFASAQRCDVDAQGRILISGKLREYAGLEKEVVFIGISDRAEIWSLDAWRAFEASGEDITSQMVSLGL